MVTVSIFIGYHDSWFHTAFDGILFELIRQSPVCDAAFSCSAKETFSKPTNLGKSKRFVAHTRVISISWQFKRKSIVPRCLPGQICPDDVAYPDSLDLPLADVSIMLTSASGRSNDLGSATSSSRFALINTRAPKSIPQFNSRIKLAEMQ